MLFLLGTGCRVSEMLRLERQDLHVGTAEAWIAESKTGAPRMVEIAGRALDALTAAGLPSAGAVFRTPKGRPYTVEANRGGQIKTGFDQARRAAGLGAEVTPHVLRHTWATWFYGATADFGRLLDLGGWARADMAQRYRKAAPRWIAAALADHGWHFGGGPAPIPDRERRRA